MALAITTSRVIEPLLCHVELNLCSRGKILRLPMEGSHPTVVLLPVSDIYIFQIVELAADDRRNLEGKTLVAADREPRFLQLCDQIRHKKFVWKFRPSSINRLK